MAVYSYYWRQESHDIAKNNVIHSALYSIYYFFITRCNFNYFKQNTFIHTGRKVMFKS